MTIVGGALGANIINQGLLVAQSAVTLSGAITTTASSILRVQGSPTYGAASLTVSNGFTNLGAIELTELVAGYGSSLAVTSGTLANASGATITPLAAFGGPRSLLAEINNQGTIAIGDAQGLTLGRASAASTNSGSLNVTGGNLTLNQTGASPSFTNTGTVAIDSAQTWTVNGGTLDVSTGTTAGAGTLIVNGVILAFNTAAMTVPITFNGTTTIVGGSVTIPYGQTLTIAGGTLNAPIANNGLLIAQGATNLGGAYTANSGSITRVQGNSTYGVATLTFASGFTNNATIELTELTAGYGATINVASGTLTNASTGTISSLAGFGGPRTIGAQLDNQGNVAIARTTTLAKAGAAHTNSGTVSVTAGTFVVTQTGTTPTFANTGTMALNTSTGLQVTGGTFTNAAAGLVQGPGTLDISGTTFVDSGTIAVASGAAAGLMNLTGNYNQSSSGVFNTKLGGTSAGPGGYDRLGVTGTLTLSGTLNVTLFGGFVAYSGHTYTIMTFVASPVGNFTTINLPAGCSAAPTTNQYNIVC
ncbi:MAG: hypothetical protein ABI442_17825 [Gemmatimonadaceae bacterium]